MAADKLPLYGEVNRPHMLRGLRSRGFVVPNSDYPASTSQSQQYLQDNPNTLRRPSGADMYASMYPPIIPPRAPPRSSTNPCPQEQESLRTGHSRLASRSNSPMSDSRFAHLIRQRQETTQTTALFFNTRSTSNPISPQSLQLLPQQQQHAIQKVNSWLDSTNNSLATPGHDPQSSQQNRQPQESLIRGLQDLQLAEPTRDRSRLTPGERIELFIKIFLRDGPEDFEKTFERSLDEAISEELKVIIDMKMEELGGEMSRPDNQMKSICTQRRKLDSSLPHQHKEQPSQLGQGSSQMPQRMDPQLGGRFTNHRPTEFSVQSSRVLATKSSKLLLSTVPLQPDEMNETQGFFIHGLPRAFSAGGPTLEFAVTLGVRPEETFRMNQRWQDFFSFGHVQVVRQLLEVHRVKCNEDFQTGCVEQAADQNEELESGAGIGAEQAPEEAKDSQGDGCSDLEDMEDMGDTGEMDDMQDMEKTWRGWKPWKT